MRYTVCQLLVRVDKDQFIGGAIMCDLSIEWPVMSKHCTSSDYAFEDETESVLRSCCGWLRDFSFCPPHTIELLHKCSTIKTLW